MLSFVTAQCSVDLVNYNLQSTRENRHATEVTFHFTHYYYTHDVQLLTEG